MKKLTDWHPPHVKPVHVGVYETDAGNQDNARHATYQLWDGKKWGAYSYNATALYNLKSISMFQNVRWRGYTTQQD